MSLQFTL